MGATDSPVAPHWVDTLVEWLQANRTWLRSIPKGHIEVHGAGTVIRPNVTRAFGEVKPN